MGEQKKTLVKERLISCGNRNGDAKRWKRTHQTKRLQTGLARTHHIKTARVEYQADLAVIS